MLLAVTLDEESLDKPTGDALTVRVSAHDLHRESCRGDAHWPIRQLPGWAGGERGVGPSARSFTNGWSAWRCEVKYNTG